VGRSELWAALSYVCAVVVPLTVLNSGKARNQSGQESAYDETSEIKL